MDSNSPARYLETRDETDPSLDAVFEILAEPRRRFALTYLHERSKSIAIADLIREISADQHETAKNEVPEEVLQQETTTFHHCHLPKLVDANLVAINADRNTVMATDTLQSIEQFLAIVAEIGQ
jgi:DNA-binding transcriptional ArsR family regulator